MHVEYLGSPIAHISVGITFLTDLLRLNAIIYDLLRNYPGPITILSRLKIVIENFDSPELLRLFKRIYD